MRAKSASYARKPSTSRGEIAATDAGRLLLVVPLNERGAVFERCPLGRVDGEGAVAAAGKIELVDHQRVEQPDEVRARAHHEALVGEGSLEGARATELVASLQDEHRRPARAR